MNIQERMDSINDVIKNIAEFIQNNDDIKQDFNEYLQTIGATTPNGVPLQTACFSYILERNLGEDLKSIPQLYLENTKGLDKDTKNIVEAIDESISSVFEIKKVTKTGFELLNIVNERKYMITSLMKMTAFRGLGSGDYIIARIVDINGDYYLLEISGVLPATRKDDAYRFAVAKIIQNPELVYLDNPEKQKEITLFEAIGHLPSLDPLLREGETLTREKFPDFDKKKETAGKVSKWHYPPKHSWKQVEWMMHTPTGKSAIYNEKYYPQKADGTPVKAHHNHYRRLKWDMPCRTITQNNGVISSLACVHPGRPYTDENGNMLYSDPRVLTIYELLIVMSLPMDWPIPEWADENLIRNVFGEGIPSKLVMEIMKSLLSQL